MRPPTNWVPGLIALGVALAFAIVFAVLSRKNKAFDPSAANKDDNKLLDLERAVQNALEALREHSVNAAHLTPDQFAAQKTELEIAAARAMKARDDHQAKGNRTSKPVGAAPKPTGFFANNPGLRGALVGGLAVGFFVLLGVILTQEEKKRTDGMEATGKTPGQSGEPQVSEEERQEEAEFNAAMERVRKNPDDVESLAKMTHALLRRQQFNEAVTLTERGVGVDPFHVETRVHRAMLKGAKGDLKAAVSDLEHLANTYPDAYEALLFAGAISLELGEKKRALTSFERYVVEAPASEHPPQISQALAGLRAELGE
ncbi:MAG: tetratricopeptide repeat protein [Myxococcaceae bacterium]